MGPTPEVAAVRLAVRRCLADLTAGDPVRDTERGGRTADEPGGPLVLVACSGGADSVALAAATAFEAPRARLRAGGVTVDHGLQVGSAERAAEVADTLRTLGLDPVEVLTVVTTLAGDVSAPRRPGPEGEARQARYALLAEAAERLDAAAVLLGHTRDDQAETVLLGLTRGSGARSLAGMPATRDRYRRPLLDLSRATVRAATGELPVWEDPHNADPTYARSRVRCIVLPILERELGPGVAEALARTATQLRADADALDGWAAGAFATATAAATAKASEAATAAGSVRAGAERPRGTGAVRLDIETVAALPPAVRTRVLRRAALTAGCPAADLTAAHVGELDRLLTHWHGQGPLQLPGRVEATRACGTLALATRNTGRSR